MRPGAQRASAVTAPERAGVGARRAVAGGDLRAHMGDPVGRGRIPPGSVAGAAGGAACGDVVRVSLRVDSVDPDGRVVDAGFDARGCGAAIAAGSAAVALVRGASLLDAARLGARQIAAELGGLSAAKMHAAELAADALHRALGAAAREQARLAAEPRRTLVAMSGGVDSAVAALLCRRSGDRVVGVTLELWSDAHNDAERSCCSSSAVRTARAVAHELGIAHLSLDLRAVFRAGVVDPWLAEHERGVTPNPCISCNGHVRLDAMLHLADRLGARSLATGHYARLAPVHTTTPAPGERSLEPTRLRIAADTGKDQSYALAALSARSLARMRFPLGELRKAQVRELAAAAGLAVAARRDSQDLCFLAGTDRASFLARHAREPPRPGAIVDQSGRRLGTHRGHQTVTVGQRRGLGLGGGGPLFVLATDADSNTVVVGERGRLRAPSFDIERVTLSGDPGDVDAVKLRSRGARLGCRVVPGTADAGERHLRGGRFRGGDARMRTRASPPADSGSPAGPRPTPPGRLTVVLDEPVERTAPGQLACLYSGELVVGHGTVARWAADGPRGGRAGGGAGARAGA